MISNIDATTCNLFASAAVTCNTSLSCIIKGSFNNCSVALPAIALFLNIVNLSADAGSPLNNIIEQLNSTYLTQLKEESQRFTWFNSGGIGG